MNNYDSDLGSISRRRREKILGILGRTDMIFRKKSIETCMCFQNFRACGATIFVFFVSFLFLPFPYCIFLSYPILILPQAQIQYTQINIHKSTILLINIHKFVYFVYMIYTNL